MPVLPIHGVRPSEFAVQRPGLLFEGEPEPSAPSKTGAATAGLKRLAKIAVLWLGAGLFGFSCAGEQRPDVVLILIDTLRPDHLDLYGYEKPTAPFLNKVGEGGTVFTRAFSTSSWTPPSTASLFTGLYPTRHGMIDGMMADKQLERLAAEGGSAKIRVPSLPAQVPTIAENFKAAGYGTFGLTTNLHITKFLGFDRGFDRFECRRQDSAEQVSQALTAWEAEIQSAEPSFLYLHLNDVHRPYDIHEPLYVPSDVPRADSLSRYDSEIRYLDGWIENLWQRFDWDNAIVCIVSDHGEAFGEHGLDGHGTSLYDVVNRIAMVFHGPGIDSRRTSAGASLIDVLPTLLELADIRAAQDLDGLSLVPALRGEGFEERSLFAHRGRVGEPDQHWSVIKDNWKLVQDRTLGTTQLFDLESDPGEERDLFEREVERAEQLGALLEQFRATRADSARNSAEVSVDSDLLDELRLLGYAGDDPEDEHGNH